MLTERESREVKAEFRRLNLHLTFTPVGSDTDKAFFHVNGQCDLSALAFSRLWPASSPRSGAFLSPSLARPAAARNWLPGRSIDSDRVPAGRLSP
jgi:hypothetical protein